MGIKIEVATANEWHVMKGEQQFGPFTYIEMLQMLQHKKLYTFDFTWSPHLDAWTLLSDLPEFSSDRIHRIVEKSPDANVFEKRRHPRADCQLMAYVHDNHRLWKADVSSISVGGILIAISNPFLLPGDQLNVHFREGGSGQTLVSAFNARMEVLNKRMSKQRLQHDSKLQYVMQFTQLPRLGHQMIENLVAATPAPGNPVPSDAQNPGRS